MTFQRQKEEELRQERSRGDSCCQALQGPLGCSSPGFCLRGRFSILGCSLRSKTLSFSSLTTSAQDIDLVLKESYTLLSESHLTDSLWSPPSKQGELTPFSLLSCSAFLWPQGPWRWRRAPAVPRTNTSVGRASPSVPWLKESHEGQS